MLRRIENKLLFWFIVFAIIPLSITGGVSYNTGIESVRQQTCENLSIVVSSVKRQIQTFIVSQKNIAKDFSSDKEIIEDLKLIREPNTDKEVIAKGLREHLLLNKLGLYSPVLLDISVLDSDGQVVCSANKGSIKEGNTHKRSFNEVKSSGCFGNIYYSNEHCEHVIDVSAPVIDKESHCMLGVVVNTLSSTILENLTQDRWLEEYTGLNDLSTTGRYFYGNKRTNASKERLREIDANRNMADVYIVNSDKLMITQSQLVDNSMMNCLVDTEPVRKALNGGGEMVGVYDDHRGVSIIGASAFIDELGWVILIEKDRDNTFGLLFKLKAQMVVFGLITLCIVILVSTAVAKKMTLPIEELIFATKTHSVGGTDYRVKSIAKGQLGELAVSFNKMCDELKEVSVSRDFFEKILTGMSDSVIITDIHYNILFVNPITVNMLGYTNDELIGKSIHSLIFEGGILGDLDTVMMSEDTNIVKGRYITFRTKDGNTVFVNFSSFFTRDCIHKRHIFDCDLLQNEGGCSDCGEVRIISIAHDITPHKETEVRLQKARDAAEYSARVRTEFLANMSHEIRTPLNAILGLAEVLEEGVYGELNEKQGKTLHNITVSGKHLLSLINNILDISKVNAGKLDLEFSIVSIKSICEISLLFVINTAHKKNIRIIKKIDATAPSMQADELRLKQILVNLLSNAVKFADVGGAMGLEVVADKENNIVMFIVWNNGPEISSDDMNRLFKPFSQIRGRHQDNQKGTGLGLFLVKQMSEQHGGTISVESEKGKGCRFVVKLPLDRSLESVPVKRSNKIDGYDIRELPGVIENRVPSTSGIKMNSLSDYTDKSSKVEDAEMPLVLIAEDDEISSDLLSTYLNSKGFSVIIANDGSDAIKLTRERRPDIVLMDIRMPVMNGIEAARHIKSDFRTAKIPIIAVTASALYGYDCDDRKLCIDAGIDNYITKPVNLNVLVQTVIKVLKETNGERMCAR